MFKTIIGIPFRYSKLINGSKVEKENLSEYLDP